MVEPVPAEPPVINVDETLVILPLESTVIIGTVVPEPKLPVLVPEFTSVRAFPEEVTSPDTALYRFACKELGSSNGSDSERKVTLGNLWSNKAGSSQFKYFMVYESKGVEGAYKLDEFFKILKDI